MDWDVLSKDVAVYFSQLTRNNFTADSITGLSTDSNSLYVGPIDWVWGTEAEISTKLDSAKAVYAEKCNQVELILGEAGTLIERSLADRMRFDDLNLERYKLVMEFVEFYKVRRLQLDQQGDAEYWNGLITEADKAAQARGHVPYSEKINKAYTDAINSYDTALASTNDTYSKYTGWAGSLSSTAASLQYSEQVEAALLDRDSRGARTKYETKARVYEQVRQLIAQEIVGAKLKQMKMPGGALNYNERMIEIGNRALADFLEVVGRLNAIALGLREFYDVNSPSESDLDYDLTHARTRIEGAVTWLRKAANALLRARMDEQGCVVRRTVEDANLLDMLKAGLRLEFPATVVAKLNRPRLLGVSATAEGITGDGWIDVEVTSPSQKLSTIDITLPPVTARLGKVSTSGSLNVRDVSGGRPLLNRSPIGDWAIGSVYDSHAEQISRLHIDFHLSFS